MKNGQRVVLDARLRDGEWGGVQQFVIGLAASLPAHAGDDLALSVLAYDGGWNWLQPYLGDRYGVISAGKAPWASPLRRRLRQIAALRRLWQGMKRSSGAGIPASSGALEAARPALVHFTHQSAFRTQLPSIYQPWDLQHVHLPQFFTKAEIARREAWYAAFCQQASAVVVASSWARQDIARHFGLAADKVFVIPAASVLEAYPTPSDAQLRQARAQHRLPERFIYYPAQTWPHKNHIALLEALALLRDQRGVRVPVVFTGKRTDHAPAIDAVVQRRGLAGQVHWLGYTDTLTVASLYRLCAAVVFPSLFEGWGLPVSEAMQAGAPVACSTATSLPDLVGDAALTFSPHDPTQIAEAVLRLWQDDALRAALAERGRARSQLFTWERAARAYAALYRRLLGLPQPNDDHILLENPLI